MRMLAATAIAVLMLGAGAVPARASLCGSPDPAPFLAAGELAFVGTG